MVKFLIILSLIFPLPALSSSFSTQYDKIIHQRTSLYRNILVVDGDGYRCMTFGRFNGQQSCIDPDKPDTLLFPYYQGLMRSTDIANGVNSILVIGVGGGVIPLALARHYPSAVVDAVELDKEVVNIARDYFQYRETPNMTTYVDDGRMFVRKAIRTNKKYDLIVMDAFDKESIPEHLATQEFYHQLNQLLTPTGLIATNTFSTGPQIPHENATYLAVFQHLYELNVGSNRVLFAFNHGDLAEKMTQGFKHLHLDTVRSIKPFTDQFAPINVILCDK